MFKRQQQRVSAPPTTPALARRSASPALAVQRALGNRATTRLLSLKPAPKHGTFENSVRIDNGPPIEIKESNIADWIGKKGPGDQLVVTTVAGKQSDELKRKSDGKERIDTLEVSTITGQNTWVVVTIKHARIKGYEANGKTEHWTAVDFDAVDFKRLAIGTPRP
jgi:hypothetical protein